MMPIESNEAFMAWLRNVNGFHACKSLGNGLYVGIKPLLFHWTMIVGEIGDRTTYADRWCYVNRSKAEAAIAAWDGFGEPQGWHRHPSTGRRRPDGDPEREYIDW
jgi:hypothetical protein